MSKKEVAVVADKTVSTQVQAPAQLQGILASDVIVPQIILMQGTSDFVKERKAQLGDIVRSTTAEKLGDPDKGVDFIPLAPPMSDWVLEQKNASGKFEYRSTMPRNSSNEMLPWLYTADAKGNEVAPGTVGSSEWRRVKRLKLYAILPCDIAAEKVEKDKILLGEMPDISKALTPVMLSFRSTSFNAGKDVVTFFTQAASFGMDPWRYVLKLNCFLDKNDLGSYYVYSVDRKKPVAVCADCVGVIQMWAKIVTSQTIVTHEPSEAEANVVVNAGDIC